MQELQKYIVDVSPSIDDWLDAKFVDQRRSIEFVRPRWPANEPICCKLWIHNYKGVTLHAKASAENSGDAFLEALRLIEQAM